MVVTVTSLSQASKRPPECKPASISTTSSPQDGGSDDDCEDKDHDTKTEGEDEDSEDLPPLRIRRETTETEFEDSDREDFPTEGLLKELHFLNASCERPSFKKNAAQHTHKTPKKQRKLDFGSQVINASASSTPGKSSRKKTSPRKRSRCNASSPDKQCQQKVDSGTKRIKFHKSSAKEAYSTNQLYSETSDEEPDGLTIVAQEEKPKKRKGMVSPAKTKKKARGEGEGDVPQEVIELIKSGVDEVFEEKAERTHLTAIHVKNIIKNVMTDENVLAMVRNSVLSIHGKGAETPAVYEPTLTRAKTKELMEQQAAGVGSGNIWAGLSNSSAGGSTLLNPETRALLHSDDESLVSTGFGSENGSPTTPCTPSTSRMSSNPGSRQSLNTPLSSRSTPANQRLLAFKTPSVQKKNVQRILNFDKEPPKEEVVSQRTRSKLPLTETPLECLEMAFKPPDVTKDMYETEVDNEDWKSFLIDFIHPLKSTEVVEDEEADPEYNILEDKEDALDLKEEMRGDRAVQISKKEFNELLTELFETLGNSEGIESLRMHLSQNTGQKEGKKSQFKESEACQPSENKEEDSSPGTIWVEILIAEFSTTQLKILQCQMVQHVQLLTTSSLMCFGISSLGNMAEDCIQHLRNADASDFKNTFFRPFNLKPSLETFRNFKRISSKDLSSEAQPLITIGLQQYLDPKYWYDTCRKVQYRQLLEALDQTVKSILVSKTLSQATNRVKNIRSRANDAPNNPVLKFLETGKLDLPPAEVETLLPCVPCSVQDFPETSLPNPFQKQVKKRNASLRKTLQDVASKALLACEAEKKEAIYRGAGSRKKLTQNILIVQSSGGSNQLLIPPQASESLKSSVVHQSPAGSVSKLSLGRMPDMPSPSCSEQIGKNNQSCSFGNLSTAPDTRSNQSSHGNILFGKTGNTVASSLVSYSDGILGGVSVDCCREVARTGDDVGKVSSSSPRTTLELNCQSSRVELKEKTNVKESSSGCAISDTPDDNHEEVRDGEIMDDTGCDDGIASDTDSLPDLNKESNQNEPEGEVRETIEKQDVDPAVDIMQNEIDMSILPRTPQKLHSSISPSNLSFLDMPSLLTSVHKSDRSDSSSVSFNLSPLHTPSPHKSLNTPVKAIEIKQTDLLPVFEKEERNSSHISTFSKNPLDSVAVCTSTAPVVLPTATDGSCEPSVQVCSTELTKGTRHNKQKVTQNINDNCKTKSLEKSNTSDPDVQLQNPCGTTENLSQMNTASQNPANQSNSVTLVTSVYQSPISSSGVGEASPIDSLNISLQKTKPSYRRISPAKGFRSPMKTSPLKQVSPILRKYHKYSPKKRRPVSTKKLSPILPKISRRPNPLQRRLAPKPSKSSSTVQDGVRGRHSRRTTRTESFLHGNKETGDGDLLQMEDELMETNTSIDSTRNLSQPGTVHQSEEEFEGYSLEDEDEEDEDEEDEDEEEEEEEDLEAAQQREEHLAALLKASSTIALRRGGGGDGFDKRLNGVGDVAQGERRLTKQQRRLQARISALSYSPDTVSQDKFMAQSFLMRVREALVVKDPSAFKEFLCILNEFIETPSRSPLQLYYQLSEVLKDYQHLTEEFVSFLLPQQAMAIGKYPQYCAIHRMRDFLEKLELQFCKQPKYIQKIIRLLQSMQNSSDVNIEEVKAAMTPLLKYPHLVECFIQCFPSQPPAPSLPSDFEDISIDHPGTPDSMESLFSEGRIYLQCGKTLRPAKVTYQTPNVKKEEFDDKNTHNQANGGNGQTATDLSETSTKSKSLGKGKLSQAKDPSENVPMRNKENANKVASGGNPNSTMHGTALKSRTVVSCEEKSAKEDTGVQVENVDGVIRGRGDNVDTAKDTSNSRNHETICGKNESVSDGKISYTKKTCANKGHERLEGNTSVEAFVRCASHCKSGFPQSGVKASAGGSVENSSISLRNKNSSGLPYSSPKEVYNDSSIAPSCSNINSFRIFGTMNELGQKVSVLDEREKPSAGAVIITDKFELQKEYKATICHVPLTALHTKTVETRESSNAEKSLNEELSANSNVDNQNAGGASQIYFSHCSSVKSSKTATERDSQTPESLSSVSSSSHNQFSRKHSRVETKRRMKNITEDLDISPIKSSSSSSASLLNDPFSSVTPSSLKYVGWTKDEDRMILTLVQQKGATDAVFQEIADALPSREYHEVLERFNILVRLMMEETDVEDTLSISSEDSMI
ncbi:GON-4-like protein-like [Homarus americanus]|uniref:GON-4-like protein-like n=1 Tax=Homarus americanus TaxID=6706 RepID=A0A8J5KIH3_HOMAM|nr:GON-4-like protein-like [Homarus americanus]